MTIKEVLYDCQAKKTAVLATNFYNYETLVCVARAAQAMKAPVMLMVYIHLLMQIMHMHLKGENQVEKYVLIIKAMVRLMVFMVIEYLRRLLQTPTFMA